MKMRPVDMIFGPCGAIKVEQIDNDTARVYCRNGVENTTETFDTTPAIADKIWKWRTGETQGMIQDIVPELSAGLREMCMSGVTPEMFETLKDDDE